MIWPSAPTRRFALALLAFALAAACGNRTPLSLEPPAVRDVDRVQSAGSGDPGQPTAGNGPGSSPSGPAPEPGGGGTRPDMSPGSAGSPQPQTPRIECDPQWLGSLLGDVVASGELGAADGSGSWVPSMCGGEGRELTFLWEAPFDGEFQFDTHGSGYDTTLSLIAGERCDGLELACNDDAFGSVQSQLRLAMTQGQRVVIVLDARLDAAPSARYALSITQTRAIEGCPTIVADAVAQGLLAAGELEEGGSQFGEACNGSGASASVLWIAPYDGVFYFDTLGSSFDTVLSMYADCEGQLLVCNDDTFDLISQVSARFMQGQQALLVIQAFDGGEHDGRTHWQLNISEGSAPL